MAIDPDEVAKEVGQEIDKRQLRFSELLLGLSAGTIGAISIFLLRDESINNCYLQTSLIFLAISTLAAFAYLAVHIWILKWNYHFRRTQGLPTHGTEYSNRKQRGIKILNMNILVFQSLMFVIGEMFLILRVLD